MLDYRVEDSELFIKLADTTVNCTSGEREAFGWIPVTFDAANTKPKLMADRFVFIIIEQMN